MNTKKNLAHNILDKLPFYPMTLTIGNMLNITEIKVKFLNLDHIRLLKLVGKFEILPKLDE